MFEKILVCLDGSSLAEQILPHVAEAAQRLGSKVILLRVVTMPVIASAMEEVDRPHEEPRQFQVEEREARDYLRRVAEHMRAKGLAVEYTAIHGDPGEVIVHYAAQNEIGIIALATHGRSGLGRAVFGSVADFVLKRSGRPILLIKPQ